MKAKVGAHPWSRSAAFTSGGQRSRLLPFSTELRANSSFPYGSNDGAVWAGRGLTASATVGVSLHAGPVWVALAPIAFLTQNATFDLRDNGETGNLRFGDGQFPRGVDRPQRFGDGSYGRIDLGNSTVRADVGFVAVGLSTANNAWGPFELYPFVLGTNAPGFAHGFVGTSRPVNVWLGRLHGRVIWGRLAQSAYSPVEGSPTYSSPDEPGTKRFASGLLAIFEPRGTSGLELGIARFFHSPWLGTGIPFSHFTKPFENILKHRLKGGPAFDDPANIVENQVISGFARWTLPAAGFEIYAEYGRDDHSWDARDFVQEPDHSRSYGLGLRKIVRLRPEKMDGVTFELINFQLPHLVRSGRGEGLVYTHHVMRQGHTHLGQLLGADVGVGSAAAATFRWDSYRPGGRSSVALHRVVREDGGTFFENGVQNPNSSHVQYALEAVRMRRLQGVEVLGGLALIHEFNRHFRKDASGLSAFVKTSMPLSR